jgi:hypothetical protein
MQRTTGEQGRRIAARQCKRRTRPKTVRGAVGIGGPPVGGGPARRPPVRPMRQPGIRGEGGVLSLPKTEGQSRPAREPTTIPGRPFARVGYSASDRNVMGIWIQTGTRWSRLYAGLKRAVARTTVSAIRSRSVKPEVSTTRVF